MGKIWKLIQNSEVAPAMPSGSTNANNAGIQSAPVSAPANHTTDPNNAASPPAPTTSTAETAKQARKAFLLILQVSGAYWVAQFPSMIIRMIIFNIGYTWEDLDSRQHVTPAILIRLATFLYVPISQVIHPLFYYYSIKDLRLAFLRLIGKNNHIVYP